MRLIVAILLAFIASFGIFVGIYWLADTSDGFFVWLAKYLGFTILFVAGELSLLAATYWLCSRLIALSEWAGHAPAIYLRHVSPTQFAQYGESLGGAQGAAGLFVTLITLFGVFVLYHWLEFRLATAICLAHGIGLLAFFATLVYEYRKRDRWEFYQARRLAMPYIVGASVSVAFVSFVIYSVNVGFAVGCGALGLPSVAGNLHLPPPWAIPFGECIVGFTWGLAAVAAIVWLLPPIVKKDWAEVGCLAFGAAAPFLLEFCVPKASDNTFVRSLVPGLPGPVAPVLVGLAAGWLLDKLRSGIDPDIECPACRTSISPPANYCPNCGTEVTMISNASSANQAELDQRPDATRPRDAQAE